MQCGGAASFVSNVLLIQHFTIFCNQFLGLVSILLIFVCLLFVAAGHVLVTWYDRVTSPNAMSAATSCPSAALATIELTTSTQQQQQQQLQKKSKKTSLEPQTPSTPTTTGAPGTTTTQKA